MGNPKATINDGDTAWLLCSTALVFIMTPGLAFFYGGLVHGNNVIHTMMMSLVCIAIISVLWLIIGYSLAFGPGDGYIGYGNFAGLYNVYQEPNPNYISTVPHYAFMCFQLMFAIITPALISGSIVGRIRFKSYLLFLIMWSLIVYDPVAHWVWSGWIAKDGTARYGWLRALGALDFAGGTVVHIISGVSGPVVAIFLGARKKREDFIPHNVPFVLLGAGLLWFGWFGFNAGSALQASGLASVAFVNTHMAASSGFCTWMMLELIMHKPSSVGGVTGSVVGLVGITPAAGFVEPWAAIVIGIVTVLVCFGAVTLKKRYKDHGYLAFLDDSLDVFCCHGVGGMTGALLTGLFATKSVNPLGNDGAFYGNGKLFGIQLCAVVTTASYAIVVTSIIMTILKYVVGIRVSETKENEGLDKSVHGEKAYASVSIRNVFQRMVSKNKIYEDIITINAPKQKKPNDNVDNAKTNDKENHKNNSDVINSTSTISETQQNIVIETKSEMVPIDENLPLKKNDN